MESGVDDGQTQRPSRAVRFRDREDAGQTLASILSNRQALQQPVVLALPRGGVPVAYPIAVALDSPLDVLLVRKLGLPMQPELAMGAIASGGICILNHDVVDTLGIPPATIDRVAAREQQELERREHEYRGDHPAEPVSGRTVVIVDDGLATGSTMRAAIESLRKRGPAEIVVAVPVAAPSVCEEIGAEADEIVCAVTPEPFAAVGLWYEDFSPTSDEQVRSLLQAARERFSTRH